MRWALILAVALSPGLAFGQSQCALTQGQIWTIAQWNTCFNSLAPVLNPAISGGTFAGGTFSGPIISTPAITGGAWSGGTVSGATETPAGGIGAVVVVATAAGTINPSVSLQETVVVLKASPAATSVVLPAATNWPSCPSAATAQCPVYTIKDGAGNAATYPITVTAQDGKTFDGANSATVSTNYGSAKFELNGTQWNSVP